MPAASRADQASASILLVLADMLLRIQLEPELTDQVGLGFQVIDVSFLVAHERLKQIARDVILD
jgi:hypothetical protein